MNPTDGLAHSLLSLRNTFADVAEMARAFEEIAHEYEHGLEVITTIA